MRRLIYRTAARRQLVELLRHLAEESESRGIARSFVDGIKDHCRRLAALPGLLGRARPELGPDFRSAAHRGYIIFFRYDIGRLDIIAILSAARDVDAWFDGRETEE